MCSIHNQLDPTGSKSFMSNRVIENDDDEGPEGPDWFAATSPDSMRTVPGHPWTAFGQSPDILGQHAAILDELDAPSR